jgi:hypothetical protein
MREYPTYAVSILSVFNVIGGVGNIFQLETMSVGFSAVGGDWMAGQGICGAMQTYG